LSKDHKKQQQRLHLLDDNNDDPMTLELRREYEQGVIQCRYNPTDKEEYVHYRFVTEGGEHYVCSWTMEVSPRRLLSKSVRLNCKETLTTEQWKTISQMLLTGKTFEHKWRKNNECEETRSMFGDVEVAHAWLWRTEDNPQPCDLPERASLDSLSSEEIMYMTEDGPKGEWKDGFCSSKEMKEEEQNNFNFALWENLFNCCKEKMGVYGFRLEKEDGEKCDSCWADPCRWKANKETIIQSTEVILGGRDDVANKNRRYFAYRQAAYVWCEGPPHERVRLPNCMVNGIRELWPEEDGKYVGHKDA
jgi:hypothetical protein